MIVPGVVFENMMGGGKPPFTFSGSWEASDEGWTRGSGMLRSAIGGRTGDYVFRSNSATEPYADYTIAAGVAGGMAITVSVYQKSRGSAYESYCPRIIEYRIGSGSFVLLAEGDGNIDSYALRTASFNNAGANAVTIRLRTAFPGDGNFGIFDDWLIEGVAL